MRVFPAALLAIVSATASITFGLDRPPAQAERMDWLRNQAVRTADGFVAKFKAGEEDESTRHYTYAAHYWLALGRPPQQAEAFIRHAMDSQIMDAKSEDFGVIPWRVGHPEMKDANSIQFTMLSMGPILAHYRDRLSPEFLGYLKPHLKAGIVASRNQKVLVSYTNIFLMRACNLILLGEAVDDAQAIADGTKALNDWLDFTRKNGITEFCSPTYTSTAMNDLLVLYRSTKTSIIRDTTKIALDMYWTDAAGAYFAPGGTLGGAHSRNYDFLAGTGATDWFAYYEGIRNAAPIAGTMSDGLGCFTNAVEDGYHPDAATVALTREHLTRVFTSPCGDTPGRDRYTYFTPDFAFGTTSCNAGPQDLPISFAFANPDLPHISILSDNLDAPYGMAKAQDSSGHVKPHHIAMPLSCVQDKGAMLALINAAKDLKKPAESISVNVIFPLAFDELSVDGRTVTLPEHPSKQEAIDWSVPVKADSVLAIRKGDAACVVRLFDVQGLDGFKPEAALKMDGSAWGAGRLAVYQYRGESKTLNLKQSRIGVLMLAGPAKSKDEFDALVRRVQDAKLKDDLDAKQWHVVAAIGGQTLEAGLDLETSLPTERSVDGRPFGPLPFAIDGRDVLSPIWARLDRLRAGGGA